MKKGSSKMVDTTLDLFAGHDAGPARQMQIWEMVEPRQPKAPRPAGPQLSLFDPNQQSLF